VLPYDILTFDCYGTLIDWETGIGGAIAGAARAAGVELERETILQVHAEVEPQIQAERFRSYREVLELVALATAERLGWELAPELAAFLPASLPDWPPLPDTNAALAALEKKGYRLGILSNVDDDLLAGSREHLTADFELIVTAELVGAYKPATPHFLHARKRIGSARWLHVAQSYFHDVEPAVALGVPVVWVNRKHEAPTGEARPLAEVATLAELVDWLVPQES
jgi:2-haloalkanoic acid dehalogenase type II